jgi:ABC-type microcin C transport system duplicated ATPase subunit YejF
VTRAGGGEPAPAYCDKIICAPGGEPAGGSSGRIGQRQEHRSDARVMMLNPPTAGSVRFEGEELRRAARGVRLRAVRRRMQIVFQDPYRRSIRGMTVGAISWPSRCEIHGVQRHRRRAAGARSAELFRRVGLDPDFASRYPHQFSRRQRPAHHASRGPSRSHPRLHRRRRARSPRSTCRSRRRSSICSRTLQEALGVAYFFISQRPAHDPPSVPIASP